MRKSAKQTLSRLYAQHTDDPGKPSVQVFEGEQRLALLYAEVTHANSVCAWFGLEADKPAFQEVFYQIAESARHDRIRIRDIISKNRKSIAFVQRLQRLIGPSYSYRIAPSTIIENDTLVFGNTVAIFRVASNNTMYAVRIQDAIIANGFRAIFDITWKALPEVSKKPQVGDNN